MQHFINAQTKRPTRQWVYDIVHNRREKESVIYRDDDLGFVLVSCPSESTQVCKGYIAIVYDTRLRCLRDLRGSDVPMLETLKEECLQRLPADVTHCSIHYHPSVYQLHVHFRTAEQAEPSAARAFLLDDVLANLRADPAYFKTQTLVFSVLPKSDLYRVLMHVDRASVWYQRATSYHPTSDEVCSGLARLRLSSDALPLQPGTQYAEPRRPYVHGKRTCEPAMDTAAIAVPVYITAGSGALVLSRYVVVRETPRMPAALDANQVSRLLFAGSALRLFATEHAPLCVVVRADYSAAACYYTQTQQGSHATLRTCLQSLRGADADAFQNVRLAEEIEGECFVPVWSLLIAYTWDAAAGGHRLQSAQQAEAGQLHLPRVCTDEAGLLYSLAVQRDKAVARMLAAFTLAVGWVDGSWLSYGLCEDGSGLLPLHHHGLALPCAQRLDTDPCTEWTQHLE